MACPSAASSTISTRAPCRPRSGKGRRCRWAKSLCEASTSWHGIWAILPTLRMARRFQLLEMPAPLQECQEGEAGECDRGADHEEPEPAGRRRHVSSAGGEISGPERRQRGEQRVLRRRVQRVATEGREVGDEDHGADRTGELLGDDGKGEHRSVVTDERLRRERE